MKFALTTSHLAKKIPLHETDKLILKSAERRGLETILVDPLTINYFFDENNLKIFDKEQIISDSDILFIRRTKDFERPIYDLAKAMEHLGKTVIDPSIVLSSPSKILGHIVRQGKINYPNTLYLPNKKENLMNKLNKLNMYCPLIIKPIKGREGEGIKIILKDKDLKKYIPSEEGVLVQEYIPIKEEYRILIIGKRSLGVCKKKTDSLIKNAAKGSNFEYFKDNSLEKFALTASSLQGGDIYGVDIVETKKGELYLIECNRSPNFIEFKKASGIKVEDEIVDYCIDKFSK